jgi:GTPase
LNPFVESLHFEERKIYYVTQASVRPPTFVFFTNSAGPLHFSHERYLIFRGTPVAVKTRAKKKS